MSRRGPRVLVRDRRHDGRRERRRRPTPCRYPSAPSREISPARSHECARCRIARRSERTATTTLPAAIGSRGPIRSDSLPMRPDSPAIASGQRHEDEAGHGFAEAPAGNQQHRQVEEDRGEREIEKEGRRVGSGEGADAKEREVDHRITLAAFPEDESRQRPRCRPRRGPAAMRSIRSGPTTRRSARRQRTEPFGRNRRAAEIEVASFGRLIGRNLEKQQEDG